MPFLSKSSSTAKKGGLSRAKTLPLFTDAQDKTPELLALVKTHLQPVLEKWVGRPLILQRCHGIREYRRGGLLKRHVDW